MCTQSLTHQILSIVFPSQFIIHFLKNIPFYPFTHHFPSTHSSPDYKNINFPWRVKELECLPQLQPYQQKSLLLTCHVRYLPYQIDVKAKILFRQDKHQIPGLGSISSSNKMHCRGFECKCLLALNARKVAMCACEAECRMQIEMMIFGEDDSKASIGRTTVIISLYHADDDDDRHYYHEDHLHPVPW